MGFYVEVPSNFNKARQIVDLHGGEILRSPPKSYADIPAGKALICIVDNVVFEAAGFAFDEREFADFTRLDDPRPQTYVLMDRAKAEEITGYAEHMKEKA